MVNSIDPIMDSTPVKRRKISDNEQDSWGKAYDSADDSGDELNENDFEPATIATLPMASQKRKQLQHTTQPTQPLISERPISPGSQVQVGRSSPLPSLISSPSKLKAQPAPIKRAPFAKPGLLANAMAPPGTAFRRPLAAQAQPKPAVVDLDSDEDPPVQHSDDEETQNFRSNIRPTNFHKGSRELDSSPSLVQESPFASKPAARTPFTALMSEFTYSSSPTAPDDLISAYSGRSRPFRPLNDQPSSRAHSAVAYHSLDDVEDLKLRRKVEEMQIILPRSSVQQCMDALTLKRGNTHDAMDWLAEMLDREGPGNDVELSPIAKKGVAKGVVDKEPSQPLRPFAKQQVKTPTLTIAEKYGSTQTARRPSLKALDSDEETTKPRRRLVQGRKPTSRAQSPPSSPPPEATLHKPLVVIESDSESDSGVGREASEEPERSVEEIRNRRLLKFFNDCSVRELSELCASPEETVKYVLDQRPFQSLDHIRTISMETKPKAGRKSRATRPIGDKLVDDCTEMLTGYDAVDELVTRCEKIAQPLQKALRSWGVGEVNAELQLMSLDETHDSGVGTPSSSVAPEEALAEGQLKNKPKGNFIGQPENMSSEVTLKDYQLVGLNWLNLLFTKELSCILADDMGLGKTCQIIAFLSYLQLKKVDGVHLIIVPGSTLENWLREFERFGPQLNVRPYYGMQAEREQLRYILEKEFAELDVVVTTYDMAVSSEDNKFLRKTLGPFSVCVYDEAHALRNPKSQKYQQLVRIGADFKVLLTGTPLQNNLQELIAILAFIMPELFQEKRQELEYIFKHKASTKDTAHAALLSSERIARARTMMAPFILRRKKHQVLDLPAKHSRVEYCEMTDSQANLYADLLEQAQQFYTDKAAGNTKTKGKASSNVLMSLRTAAIHPLLSRRLYDEKKIDKIQAALSKSEEFGGNSPEKIRDYITGEAPISLKGGDFGLHRFCAERSYLHQFALKRKEWMDSGKVDKFTELITCYAGNGDRTLVFSQFTTVLDILESVLETLAIKFMRLDGSTKMDTRQDMLDQFTADESIPVFMLSTRAGGAGINLAAANKVIIFDSGFNPQDDIQAENRAHRVGQTREVEVVRLVTRGTIEEQIHALGESKLALDERVAGGSEANTSSTTTTTEDKKAEKMGEQIVERMLVENLTNEHAEQQPLEQGDKKNKRTTSTSTIATGGDIRDAFKKGLEGEGLRIASKQAQF